MSDRLLQIPIFKRFSNKQNLVYLTFNISFSDRKMTMEFNPKKYPIWLCNEE